MSVLEKMLDKKIVTEEQFLKIVSTQLDATPSLLTLAKNESLLAESDLVQVVRLQVQKGFEFAQAIQELNLMDQEDLNRLIKRQMQERPSLTNVVVDLGIMAESEFNRHIQEIEVESFEEWVSPIFTEQKSSSPDSSNLMEFVDKETVNSMANFEWPNFVFEKADETILEEYVEMFDESKKDDLELNVMSWKNIIEVDKNELKQEFRSFYRELHTIKGTVRFLNGVLSEYIVHQAEELMSDLIVFATVLDLDMIMKIEDVYLKCTDIIWDLRNCLVSNGLEESYYADEVWRQKAKNFISEICELKDEAGKLSQHISAESVVSQF